MEQVIQVTGLCVVGALLALVVKRGSPETALLLAVGAAVVVALALAGVVKELLAFLGELGSASGVSADLFVPLYKTIGIALVVQVGGNLCRDAGESALASVVETAGTLCALLAALPLVLALTTSAAAADLPAELERAAPEAAEDLTGGDLSGGTGFAQGVGNILDRLADQVGDVVRERTRGAAAVLLVVVLCGVVEGFAQGTGGKGAAFLPMAGALSITLASAGSLDSLMGLGSRTIGELADFSQALLPTLAAATAASGAVTTATVQQVSTVFFVDLLLRLIRQLLLPLVYLYIGLLTAAACLPENRLGAIAEALKKLVTWILTTALLVFTIYLSIVRIISGSADSATVKVAKAAISGVVPVVGGIIADASETVLAGAGMLKNTIGVFGMLAILAACAYPFLQLGVQYLLYKLTAYLASVVGAPGLCKLIDGLGGAFGLILGMTGGCALLLLISVLASVGAVMP